jgi:hypothetical protein
VRRKGAKAVKPSTNKTVVVPLKLMALLYHGCLSTVRLSNDGWEEGDEHAARVALEAVPVWLADQIEAYEATHRQSDLNPERCSKCGGAWPCAVARLA